MSTNWPNLQGARWLDVNRTAIAADDTAASTSDPAAIIAVAFSDAKDTVSTIPYVQWRLSGSSYEYRMIYAGYDSYTDTEGAFQNWDMFISNETASSNPSVLVNNTVVPYSNSRVTLGSGLAFSAVGREVVGQTYGPTAFTLMAGTQCEYQWLVSYRGDMQKPFLYGSVTIDLRAAYYDAGTLTAFGDLPSITFHMPGSHDMLFGAFYLQLEHAGFSPYGKDTVYVPWSKWCDSSGNRSSLDAPVDGPGVFFLNNTMAFTDDTDHYLDAYVILGTGERGPGYLLNGDIVFPTANGYDYWQCTGVGLSQEPHTELWDSTTLGMAPWRTAVDGSGNQITYVNSSPYHIYRMVGFSSTIDTYFPFGESIYDMTWGPDDYLYVQGYNSPYNSKKFSDFLGTVDTSFTLSPYYARSIAMVGSSTAPDKVSQTYVSPARRAARFVGFSNTLDSYSFRGISDSTYQAGSLDRDFGSLVLSEADTTALGPVIDMTYKDKWIYLRPNVGKGHTGSQRVYYRGSSSSFTQTAATPTWTEWTTPGHSIQQSSWNYIQVKIEHRTTTTTTTTTSTTTTSTTTTSTSTTSTTTTSITYWTTTSTSTTAPPWTVVYGPHTLSTSNAYGAQRTLRLVIPASALTAASGTKVRVTLASYGTAWGFSEMYIGHQAASGDPWDFDGNQVQVTFGSSASGTVPASGGLESDDVTWGYYDEGKDLIVSMFMSAAFSVPTDDTTHTGYELYESIPNVAGISDPAMTEDSTNTGERVLVEAIEVGVGY